MKDDLKYKLPVHKEGEPLSLQEAFDKGFDMVQGYVDRSFAEVYEKVQGLEKRIKELEGKRR